MKKLKIQFTDFWPEFDKENNWFITLLKPHYDLELSDKPDVLFYSCYSANFLRFNCPRIFYTGENIRPDYRFCDFAISFDHSDNHRHFRLPLFRRWFSENELTKTKFTEKIYAKKRGFCSFVVSNSTESEERIKFFHLLMDYKKVASGGKYANNVGGPIDNKRVFISKYLFNIAFENSSYPGYTTEKIAEPWVEGCIPIYWGDPEITKDINPDCFINVRDFNSFEEAIEHVKKVDTSVSLQMQYLNAPFFRNNEVPEYLKDEFIANKLKQFIEQCTDGLPNKASIFWHKPYYYIRKIRGASRLININLR